MALTRGRDLRRRASPRPGAARLTERLGIRAPVLLAPMDVVSGGRLAAAVTEAGGLGLVGGGYGDAEWLRRTLRSSTSPSSGARWR